MVHNGNHDITKGINHQRYCSSRTEEFWRISSYLVITITFNIGIIKRVTNNKKLIN
jgi:hypothetical protein